MSTQKKIHDFMLWTKRQSRALRQDGTKARLLVAIKKLILPCARWGNRLLERTPCSRRLIIKLLKLSGLYQWSCRMIKPLLNYPKPTIGGLSRRSDEKTVQIILDTMPLQTQLLYQEISMATNSGLRK